MKRLLSALLRTLVAFYITAMGKGPRRLAADETPPAPGTIVIVSNTALGDTILSTPVVASIRSSFPRSNIVFVVHPRMLPLFSGLECADRVLCYDGGYKHLFSFIATLRRLRPDAVLLAHSNGPQDIPLAVLSGSRIVLKPPTRSAYRTYLSADIPAKPQHVIEERLDLARYLGARQITTCLQLPARYRSIVHVVPVEVPANLSIVIGFQLGAANHYKMWPMDNFAELACQLFEADPRTTIVLTGTRQEAALANEVKSQCRSERIIDATGKCGIEALPDLLKQLNLLVTNDTGTMHLAIALGIPTISLFGATSSAAIGPYQDPERHIVLEKKGPAQQHLSKKSRTNEGMRLITVEEVIQAVDKLRRGIG